MIWPRIECDTPKADIAVSRGEAEFRYSDVLATGSDDTPDRLLTTESDSEVKGPKGQQSFVASQTGRPP